jgi:hypothetical protein
MEGFKLSGQWKVLSLVANGRFQTWWPMECSKLGGQWKVPCLVANEMFHACWPMKGSMLGGQWKVPSLVANGMFQAWWLMECEGETPFHLFHFPPNNLYPNLQFFPLTLRFYFTMVLSRYSRLPFPFLRSINHNCAPQCNKSSTLSLSI